MIQSEESEDYEKKFQECDTRSEAVFSLTSAPSKIIDSDLTILKVNEALSALLGYSKEELIGTQILDYACEADKPHWHALQDAMWKKGKPNFKLDACIIRKDGRLVWVHVTTIAFKENDTAYAYTILDDFTDWKKLQESEQKLTMALKYSNLAVWELDLVTRRITRSEGFDQLFGYSGNETDWDERKLLQMFFPDDRIRFETMLNDVRVGQNIDFEGRIQTRNGLIKWINFHGKVETTQHEKDRILGTLSDITRDKLAQREKDDFISIASHELKTPLTALKGSLQVLERMKDAPTSMLPPLLAQASKSMSKVASLVDELLNASRMTEGQLHLKKSRFNLSKAIDECCLHINAAGNYRILTQGIKDAEVEADFERIQRVIVNFVNNAVKYAAMCNEIIIRVEHLPNHIKVTVSDTGPGIAKEKIPHLFERFYRVDQNGSQYAGLGLGLYISAEIVRKHGGEIGVDSEPGTGSNFWFTLPVEH
jgi:PAS domain S-box-containing protein